jgi:hypothetical protein
LYHSQGNGISLKDEQLAHRHGQHFCERPSFRQPQLHDATTIMADQQAGLIAGHKLDRHRIGDRALPEIVSLLHRSPPVRQAFSQSLVDRAQKCIGETPFPSARVDERMMN